MARIRLSLRDGRTLLWHKGGRVHDLREELVPIWLANFQPTVFQVMPDGHIVPRGSDPKAMDIVAVARDDEVPLA